jgi:hypothetical protein
MVLEVNSLTVHPSSFKIDFSRAIQNACLNCGDKHQEDCPVGMAKAQIKSTNDLLIQFYRTK